MSDIDTDDFFDYWCPKCNNYVLLEKWKDNENILEGKCALCGLNISMLYNEWEKYDKKKFKKEDEEVNNNV